MTNVFTRNTMICSFEFFRDTSLHIPDIFLKKTTAENQNPKKIILKSFRKN